MGPGLHPVETEIVRIGNILASRILGRDHPILDAVALGIGDRLLSTFEGQANLLPRVGGTRIAMIGSIVRGLS